MGYRRLAVPVLAKRLWLPVLLLSLVVFALGALATAQLRRLQEKGPLLEDPTGLAVDAEGHVFCTVGDTRIYRYAPDGRLVDAWRVQDRARPLRLRVEGDVVEVATPDGGITRYDLTGRPVGEEPDPTAWHRFGPPAQEVQAGSGGARYALTDGSIVRREGGVEEVFAAGVPRPLRWFPSHAVLAAFVGLGPVGLLAAIVLRGRRASP